MKKLYEANEILFTVVIAIIDLILHLIGRELSWLVGINKSVTALLSIPEIIFLYLWIRKNGLKEKYGFCKIKTKKEGINIWLLFLPLLLLLAIQFTREIRIHYSLPDAILFIIVSMRIGFMEELVYRGFLFKALCKYDEGIAILLSGTIFGLSHFMNLLWGDAFIVTIIQVFYASATGFLFCVIFYVGKSIWPCIITHGLFNSVCIFLNEETTLWQYYWCGVLQVVISIGFGLYILKKNNYDIWNGNCYADYALEDLGNERKTGFF